MLTTAKMQLKRKGQKLCILELLAFVYWCSRQDSNLRHQD